MEPRRIGCYKVFLARTSEVSWKIVVATQGWDRGPVRHSWRRQCITGILPLIPRALSLDPADGENSRVLIELKLDLFDLLWISCTAFNLLCICCRYVVDLLCQQIELSVVWALVLGLGFRIKFSDKISVKISSSLALAFLQWPWLNSLVACDKSSEVTLCWLNSLSQSITFWCTYITWTNIAVWSCTTRVSLVKFCECAALGVILFLAVATSAPALALREPALLTFMLMEICTSCYSFSLWCYSVAISWRQEKSI